MAEDQTSLQEFVTDCAERHGVPGVSVGVLVDGAEHYAVHGVTSVTDPLPVDHDTLFQFGSTGKTFTGTAIVRLADQGKVDLDAPVRAYLPDLQLRDEAVAEKVTVLQLLNHTAGWSGDVFEDTGNGDDALQKYAGHMATVEQVTPLGATVSYNNSSLSLAGRLIEVVTGTPFEQAIKDLLFVPLGLDHCFFFPTDIMTRRFANGHSQAPDGTVTVTRPWALPRSANPAGGITSNAGDLIAWARFHLGDGRNAAGEQIIAADWLAKMREPSVESPGSAIGDAIGISWLLSDVDGVRVAAHGGDTIGQHSSFAMIPERRFALVGLTNCGPNGNAFLDELRRWAFERYVGVVERDPVPRTLDASQLDEFTGVYETVASTATVTADVERGGLVLVAKPKPEALAKLMADGEDPPEDNPPFELGLLDGDGDRYVIVGGPIKGMKGYFVRAADGSVEAVHVGGRLATRVGAEGKGTRR